MFRHVSLGIAILALAASGAAYSAPKKDTKKKSTPPPAAKAEAAPPAAPAATPLKRLDPHGQAAMNLKAASLDQYPECKVCHTQKAGKLETKAEPDNICLGCHGRLPHSGLVEHMGEEPGGGAGLTCLGCHRAHRAPLDPAAGAPASPGASFLKLNRNSPNLPSELVDKGNPNAMIDHPCTECHSF